MISRSGRKAQKLGAQIYLGREGISEHLKEREWQLLPILQK
jgi:hypothetical protein